MVALVAGGSWLAWGDDYRARLAHERGYECIRAQRYECATLAYSDAVQLAPEVVQYHVNFGVALSGRHLYDQAADEFRAALRLDPGHTNASRGLSYVSARIQGRGAAMVADELQARPYRPAR